MKPQFKNPTEKGVVLLRIRLRGFLRIREPKFGYKTFQRLRYYFRCCLQKSFFITKKTKRKWSGMIPIKICIKKEIAMYNDFKTQGINRT